jgi:pyruvate kinase
MIERGIGHAVCRWAYTPDAGFVKAGDRVVLTTGVPINVPGTTNLITGRVVE